MSCMKLIQLLFTCVFIVCSITAAAQDIITMKDSSTIKALIERITPTDITYRKAADTTGPQIVVYRQDVESITYADGEKVMMAKGTYIAGSTKPITRYSTKDRIAYGRTILSIAYLQATDKSSSDGRNVYPGLGLQFEYMLTPKQNISFYFPMTISFCSLTDENNAYPYDKIHTHSFFYIYPGFKYYPTGSNRKVSYSIGPSIALGFGRKYNVYNPGGDPPVDASTYVYPPTTSSAVFKTGVIINNGLNMMPTPHLYIGMELGLGFTFYSNDNINNFELGPPGSNNAGAPLVQFNMKVGYRF